MVYCGLWNSFVGFVNQVNYRVKIYASLFQKYQYLIDAGRDVDVVKMKTLPVPVAAQAQRSLASSATGMVAAWMGVGWAYPMEEMAWNITWTGLDLGASPV